MVRIYEQVDVAAIDGSIAACFATLLANVDYNRELQESGTLGSGTNVAGTNTIGLEHAIHLESEANEPNSSSWPSGDWTLRLNITTGNANVILDHINVCRLDSLGVNQATVVNVSSVNIPMTAQVFVDTRNGQAQPGASATDRFYYVINITRLSGAHGNQNVTITNDQLIDTPFAALAATAVKDPILSHGVVPFAR